MNYARPLDADTPTALVRAATFFGVLPLVVGCLTFLLWIPTRSKALEMAGLLDIAGGLMCFVAGMIALLVHLCRLHGRRRFARFLSTSWLAILLLFINFPTAYAIICAVDYIETHLPDPAHPVAVD